MAEANITPEVARAAVLAGRTVRIVVGPDPGDPTCLHYLDRSYEHDYEPMIFTEAIGGWSEGIKEAICEPHSAFYVEFVSDPPPLAMTIASDEPPQRESQRPVSVAAPMGENLREENR